MELAEETGVSRMTARRALTHLIDTGVLRRGPKRRLEIATPGSDGQVHQIAFLMPPVISEGVQAWQWAAEQAVWSLLDHLRGLGHRRVACFHTCTMNHVFQQRISYWQRWKDTHGVEGTLYDLPGKNGSIDYGAIQADREFDKLLKTNTFHDTAIVCTNVWTALGIQRAMQGSSLTAGRDIFLCAINDEMLAPWMNPSLTALRMPDLADMLGTCVRWMAKGGGDWPGSQLLVPPDVPLFQGDSTGPVPH
jgi:DNA-binding LacI/PurR family transcriptional regulator